jgi:hypothetical protein
MSFDSHDYKSGIATGLYEHYKGKFYLVFGTVTHSETQESLVLYAPKDQVAGSARLWVRPLSMFNERVETPSGPRPRFTLIEAL